MKSNCLNCSKEIIHKPSEKRKYCSNKCQREFELKDYKIVCNNIIKICEFCEAEHDGKYGSGRFCQQKCARSFSSLKNRKEINKKISKALTGRKKPNPKPCKQETILKIKQTWIDKLFDKKFDELSYESKRKRVKLEQFNKCNKCGIDSWLGVTITLELDHINGDNRDNRRENLEALCPNCHSLTPTWRGKNIALKNKTLISDEELINALEKSKNIHQALIKVGLSPKGKNYERANSLLCKINDEIGGINE